jgi:ABC-type transport system involved in Fe-S cluster assembly fused permease/ATPase subunit
MSTSRETPCISLRFHTRKKKIQRCFEKCWFLINVFFYSRNLGLKFHNLEIANTWKVSVVRGEGSERSRIVALFVRFVT